MGVPSAVTVRPDARSALASEHDVAEMLTKQIAMHVQIRFIVLVLIMIIIFISDELYRFSLISGGR